MQSQATAVAKGPQAFSAPAARRLKGVDICRSVAIVLAMWSHSLAEFDVARYWGDEIELLRFFMQMAPPVFICLFGVMLEVVYARRFVDGRAKVATARLLNRAVQCYLLYALAVTCRVLVGDYSPGFAVRCLLLLGVMPYTDILKFYALALLLAPLLIALRLRFGLGALVAAALTIHLAYPLFAMAPSPPLIGDKDYIGPGTRFLVGIGHTIVGGPSLLHGLALVIFGMIIGRAVTDLQAAESRRRLRGLMAYAALFALAAAAAAAMWDWSRSVEMVREIVSLELRNDNHPIYTALGLVTTMAGVALCLYLFDRWGQRWADGIRFMGATSLFTFCFGNILLILQPFEAWSGQSALLLTFTFGLLIVAQSYAFWWLSGERALHAGPVGRRMARIVQAITGGSATLIGRAIAPLLPVYLRLLGSDGDSRSVRFA